MVKYRIRFLLNKGFWYEYDLRADLLPESTTLTTFGDALEAHAAPSKDFSWDEVIQVEIEKQDADDK